ncbi:MAG: MBL fold metallo-hydrolase [Chloroflexi bacterium]|nr:MBL fold metallo-hydrolase [Chloroflexota bacterium]
MILQAIPVGRLQANCYVIGDVETREVLVIDPGDQAEALVDHFRREELQPKYVLATHAHLDHSGGLHEILEAFPAAQFVMHPVDHAAIAPQAPTAASWYGHAVTPPRAPDVQAAHGDVLAVGAYRFTLLHTPGHTPGSICVAGEGGVFTGDVLFQGSIGRHDFPGSSGPDLLRSIKEHLLTLPPETAVFPGHGPATTIEEEQRHNPFLVNPRATLGFDVD